MSEFTAELIELIDPTWSAELKDWIGGSNGGLGLRDTNDSPKTAWAQVCYGLQGSDVTTMVSRQQATLTGDANTELLERLQSYYGSSVTDLTTLLARYQQRQVA